MRRLLNITVLMDDECIPKEDPDFSGKPPAPSTEYQVVGALRKTGHTVSILGAGRVDAVVTGIAEQKPDIVFNLTESFDGDRRFDRNIAALLEMLGVPFTGTGSAGLMLSRDKGLCKQLLSLHRIRVPGFINPPLNRAVRVPKSLRYPMIVKPAYEDGSDGISNSSLVGNETELKERVQLVHERWQQAAIVEEYIQGRELYVSILGNKRLSVLPPREVFFSDEGNGGPVIATYRVKWNEEYQKKWKIKFGFARLDAPLVSNIERVCKRVYRLLQIRDYGRIDLRLTPENKLLILEVNPNPGIARGEEVSESAERAGIPYKKLISRILQHALRRYGV